MKATIKEYLDQRAAEDPQFAVTYAKPNKNIDECCNYIMQQAKKVGNAVMIKNEVVYGWAVHYYDEDDIKNVKPVPSSSVRTSKSAKSVPNVELTPEEKEAARIQAIEELKQQEKAKLEAAAKKAEEARKKKLQEKREKEEVYQPSLF